MLLLVDSGNTRIKWSVVPPIVQSVNQDSPAVFLGSWLASDSVLHHDCDQLAAAWARFPVSRIIVSNVAGGNIAARLLPLFPPVVVVDWFASKAQLAGITNLYRRPQQLGCDRFACAIGAHALFPKRNLVVVTCGTATTIDAVSANGEFVGGMILPGLQMMAQALANNTAQLPHVREPSSLKPYFADSTDEAITSGCLAAQAGAIEHAVAVFSTESTSQGDNEPHCVISGGAAPYVAGSLRTPHQLIDNLVLIGLQVSALC